MKKIIKKIQWFDDRIVKPALLGLAVFYQKTFSPNHGPFREFFFSRGIGCRFYPTCSQYFCESVEKHGSARGFFMAIKRLFRCHPF